VRIACFNDYSDKIYSILSEIERKWLFDFFDETRKNQLKSWVNDVLMLIQTKYGQFCHISEGMGFLTFWWNLEKSSEIVRNACFDADSEILKSLLSEMTFWFFFYQTMKNHHKLRE